MKLTLLIVALCASLALTHGKPEARGIFDGINGALEKVKEFYEYLKSDEFQNLLKDILTRLEGAPGKAVDCFKAAAQGSKEDIDAVAQKIQDRLGEDFLGDKDENENGFQQLRRILSGIVKALTDSKLRDDVFKIAGEYKDAAQEGLVCFRNELVAIKNDIQNILTNIQHKFFGLF